MSRPLPGLDVPIVDKNTGMMTQPWYEYFQSHQKLTQLPDVSTAAPTNGQVLIYDSALLIWKPGSN